MKFFPVLVSLLCLSVFSKCQSKPDPKLANTPGKYKLQNPNFRGSDVNKALIRDIVTIAGGRRTQDEIDSIVNISWDAISNPLTFDTIHPEFSKNTLGTGGVQKPDGTLEQIEKPWLAEWSVADSDIQWAATALDNVLTYFNIMSYGDDCEGVQGAFSNIQQTKALKLPTYKDNRDVYAYLKTINNTVLNSMNKVALVQQDYFNILICDNYEKNRLIKLLSKMEWPFVEP